MKFNPRLRQEMAEFFDYVIIVEGKKDVNALTKLGFSKVYAIHETSIPLLERVEQIMSQIDKKDKICILTDFDKRGKQLYFDIKGMFQTLGGRLDSKLRGLLLVTDLSHIEGLKSFIEKTESGIKSKKHWETR